MSKKKRYVREEFEGSKNIIEIRKKASQAFHLLKDAQELANNLPELTPYIAQSLHIQTQYNWAVKSLLEIQKHTVEYEKVIRNLQSYGALKR